MNYKWLYKRMVSLIFSPSRAWKEIESEGSEIDVQVMYVFPMLGLCALISFLASFFSNLGTEMAQYDIFRQAIINACMTVIPLFAVYMISIYIVRNMLKSLFGVSGNLSSVRKITGYSMTLMFVAYTVISFPVDFKILLWLVQVYTIYIIWEGCGCLFRLDDNKRLIFTFFLFSLLVLGGGLLYFIFYKLI